MNELRLILIGIGLLFIAGIYLWDAYKSRQQIRSRVEKISPEKDDYSDRIEITPKEEFDFNDLDALSEFKDFINDTRQDEQVSEPLSLKDVKQELKSTIQDQEQEQKLEETKEKKTAHLKDTKRKLIILYIMAEKNKHFTGPEILAATKIIGMKYGSMDIFHYYESGEIVSKKALFSLLNIIEPGLFDLKQIEKFRTHGLALFMQISPGNDNEQIFDMMLDAAWKLVEILGGELHDEQHNFVDPIIVGSLREKLYS
jgi:cell division protein ZipA